MVEVIYALLAVLVLVVLGILGLRLMVLARTVRELPAQLGAVLDQNHRAMLVDLHDGLAKQAERVSAALTDTSDRLEQISGRVSERLDEGFRKTNETFVNVMTRQAHEDAEQVQISSRMLLAGAASWTSLGERIAIFVVRSGDRATTVEIVSRPVLSAITFPPDWAGLLYGDIEQELAPLRMPK